MRRFARDAVLAVALALPLALWGTSFHVVPTADGHWRGLLDPPGTLRLATALALGATGAFVLRARGRPLLVLLLAAAPLVPALTGHGLLLLAFQGLALVPVALAAIAVTVVRAWPRGEPRPVSPIAVFCVAFALYAFLGTRLPGPAGPRGDEPHYLTMAESLRSDGDLDLKNQFRDRSYRAFFSGVLEAHTSPASPKGTIYAVHTPGLAVLILPAYALGGFAGVVLFLSAVAAFAATLVFVLVRDVTSNEWLARIASASFALLPPMAFYALSVYPETVAALAVAVMLLTARRDPGRGALLAASLAATVLPWLHPKFLPLALLGFGLTLSRRGPRLARALAAFAFLASLGGLLAWMHATYGRASLSAAYGPGFGSDVALSRAPWGALALLLDREFGLLTSGPLWILALPGLVLLLRSRPGDGLRAALLTGATLVVGASFSMWWGGTCPPARFLVPALPAFALALALALPRRPESAAALFGLGLGVVAVAALAPRALHNRADGDSALFRVLTPALDLDAVLPSFITHAPPGLPRLDPRRAALLVLEGWDETNVAGPPLSLASVTVPLDLPGAPWTLARGDMRFSRRLDLPPGVYRLRIKGRALEGGREDRVARVDVTVDDEAIAEAYVQEGRPDPEIDLQLPRGARRLSLAAVGVQGKGLVEEASLVPVSVVPRSRR